MRNSFDPGGSAPEVKMDPNAVHNCSGINCGVCAMLRRNATEATFDAAQAERSAYLRMLDSGAISELRDLLIKRGASYVE